MPRKQDPSTLANLAARLRGPREHSPSPRAPARANRRSGRRARVDFLMNRYLDGHPYLCMALDVSPGGMRLRKLSGPALTGRYLGLQFQLPGCEQVLNASGEAVRDAEGELAVRFTHVPATARAAIAAFCSSAAA